MNLDIIFVHSSKLLFAVINEMGTLANDASVFRKVKKYVIHFFHCKVPILCFFIHGVKANVSLTIVLDMKYLQVVIHNARDGEGVVSNNNEEGKARTTWGCVSVELYTRK